MAAYNGSAMLEVINIRNRKMNKEIADIIGISMIVWSVSVLLTIFIFSALIDYNII